MNRVYIALYGVGLGHASRMLLVAKNLAEHANIRFSSFGDAVDYIKMHGFECNSVAPIDFGWSADAGFSIKESIVKLPQNFFRFTVQLGTEGKNIGNFQPDVVISDTRLSSLFMAKALDIPCITILNQIKLLLSPRLREVSVARIFEDMLGEMLGTFWAKSDSVLIPDLPPPYTLSEQNIWSVDSAASKLKYIGFMASKPTVNEDYVDKVAKLLGFSRSKPIVFAHISGPAATKMAVLKNVLEAFKENDWLQFVASEGKPGGSTVPRKIRGGWYFEWCPVRDEIFAMSDLLIIRGGHSTLAQAILYGKPVLTVPIENHGEQLGNAAKAQKIGLGLMLRQKELKPKDIYSATEHILNDASFKKNAKILMQTANKLNGVENIADTVKSYF
ncbi:MAG: glycosyltransferase family protein [Nitrososphaerales archaeon]